MDTNYTREGLRPEVATLIEQLHAARKAPPVLTPEAMRANDALTAAYFAIGAPAVAVEREIQIPGPAGEMRALVYAPESAASEALPVVLYMHGGGFVIMAADTSSKICKQIAVGARSVVVSLDYRRAPESPYPAPLDDCVAAYRWLRTHTDEIGGDGSRVGVAGDSAGGNLAAAVALRMSAEGAAPQAVALLYAWLDLTLEAPAFRAFGPDDAFIDEVTMTYWRQCYAPDPAQWREPSASPLFGDLSAFPPTSIIVGGIDPLYDDGVRFAEKLRAAGRDAELIDIAGMPHIGTFFPQIAPLSDAHARMVAFLAMKLGD